MIKHFYGPLFRVCRRIVSIFCKKYSNRKCTIHDGPIVYVSHHQNLFGPFMTLYSFPVDLHCWILDVFLDKASCYKQYRDYTFSKRFGWDKMLASSAAFLFSRLVPALLNSGQGIPVYRGTRHVLQTFQQSIRYLKKNESIVIFPDIEYSDSSSTVGHLYEGFLFLEKYYYKETGQHLSFVPLYVSKSKKAFFTGSPIYFRDGKSFVKERKRIIEDIGKTLNQLAVSCGDVKILES